MRRSASPTWIDEATAGGASIATGGRRTGDGVVLPDGHHRRATRDEGLLARGVRSRRDDRGVRRHRPALALANDSDFGLQAAIFTSNIGTALKAVQALDYGGVLVNEVPTWRADQQPYGGVRDSGNTREGPAYSVREMTEIRMVVLGA